MINLIKFYKNNNKQVVYESDFLKTLTSYSETYLKQNSNNKIINTGFEVIF